MAGTLWRIIVCYWLHFIHFLRITIIFHVRSHTRIKLKQKDISLSRPKVQVEYGWWGNQTALFYPACDRQLRRGMCGKEDWEGVGSNMQGSTSLLLLPCGHHYLIEILNAKSTTTNMKYNNNKVQIGRGGSFLQGSITRLTSLHLYCAIGDESKQWITSNSQ